MEGTKSRLIEAASQLLDSGGESAVTLRAVAEAVGVSHNAPYRHFTDRNALLAAVAERDLVALSRAFRRRPPAVAKDALKTAVMHFVAYGRTHPARYRLLFSGPEVCVDGGSMQDAAREAFDAFGALVAQCKRDTGAPPADCLKLAGLIYATVRGALDIELSGHAKERNGLDDLGATVDLLLNFIWPPPKGVGAARNPRETLPAESL
jgi:AcrR family transcriptional regulator